MQVMKIEMERDASNDNHWSDYPATVMPRQHANFRRDAFVGAIVGLVIVAALWSLT